MSAPEPPGRKRLDIMPLLALVAAVLFLLAAWRLFPLLQRHVAHADCIAAGYTNCENSAR